MMIVARSCFFFFKQKTAYDIMPSLVGSEMCIRDRYTKIWGGGFQKSGIPDLICCVNGVTVAVEIKASNGRPSELQKLNVSRINHSGGVGVSLYPEGFEQFKELLKGVINCGTHIQALIALKNANSSTKCDIWTG